MGTTDVMTIFRQIIGAIARIDNVGVVKVEYVAQDMGVDVADIRLWLRLMDSLRFVNFYTERDVVALKLLELDWLGFDTRNLEDK